MKNNYLLVTAALLLISLFRPVFSSAQSTFGIQGGLHLSDALVTGPTPYVTSSQGNFFGGITARHPFTAGWALITDGQFTKRGFFLFPFYSSQADSRIGVQLMYLDLATRLEYHVFKNLHLQLGPYAGYRMTEYDQLIGSEKWVKAVYPISNKWDVGLQGGVVAHFQRWTAFVLYTHGLKTIGRLEVTDEDGNSQGQLRILNKGLQVGAGYTLFNR